MANEQDLSHLISSNSPCLCGNLRRAGRLATAVYDACLQPIDIKVTQYTLLLAIQRLEPVPVSKLANEAVLERTTCTRNLKILEDKGLIRQQPGPDRRTRQVVLTVAGKERISAARPLWEKAQKIMFEKIGEEDSLMLAKVLTRVIAKLRP